MFLDPEPKRQKMSSALPRPATEHPKDKPSQPVKRIPLREKRQQQVVPHRSDSTPLKPTIRLVEASPSLDSLATSISDTDDIQTAKEINLRGDAPRLTPSSVVLGEARDGDPGVLASDRDGNVSDTCPATNETRSFDLPHHLILHPKSSYHVVPRTASHRRSRSSGTYSNSSTLKEGDVSFIHSTRSDRFSQGTTLRGTPTPSEQEHRDRTWTEELGTKQGPAQALQTLQEASPERTTIRLIASSIKSSSTDHELHSASVDSSPTRPQTAPSLGEAENLVDLTRANSNKRSTIGPLPAPPEAETPISSPDLRAHRSQDSSARPTSPFSRSSSPIVVVYNSSPSRPQSRNRALHLTPSIESIQSRLQYPTVLRPVTSQSGETSSSWASVRPKSSNDTLPPLQIPKKRLRHKAGSQSLGASSTFSASSRMSSDAHDNTPYERQFSISHLSTIMSESDVQSRSASQHLNRFSIGSGVWTIDDANSRPFSSTSSRTRSPSLEADSIIEAILPAVQGTNVEDEPGDMTLGIYRDESAKPQPLFKDRSTSAQDQERRHDGSSMLLSPILKGIDSEEGSDTISQLQSPVLRPKRSGYSLRQRSNSTPSCSRRMSQATYADTDRSSHGSSIFPTWAKYFYGGTAMLVLSNVSLDFPSMAESHRRQLIERNNSQITQRTITSPPGAGGAAMETPSPTSNRFLRISYPRIRPRRLREHSGSHSISKVRWSKKSRSSHENPPLHQDPPSQEDRPDSMEISPAPLPQGCDEPEVTLPHPPGRAKIRNSSSVQHQPLPQKYSRQREWSEMQFPRPMSMERPSETIYPDPHLHPSHRFSQRRLSVWRAPSFVESLDTLVRSRGNRQILLFALGFLCPPLWMLAAVLPLPKPPVSVEELDGAVGPCPEGFQAEILKHEAGDVERRWREEKQRLKASWWRTLNRIMSVIGVLIIAVVIALAVVASR